MKLLRQTFKIFQVFFLIAVYMIHMGLIWIFVRQEWIRRRRLAETIAIHCRRGLKILDIEVHRLGQQPPPPGSGVLIAGNHVSYLDILVLSSHCPSCFVTSKEMQMSPLLGQICRLAGCVFVDRKKRLNILAEIGEIGEAIQNHLNVMIFPEATSSNGEKILKFRRPLFAAAQAVSCPVMPVCINYRTVDGQVVDKTNRDLICWYGDMGFLTHIWRLAGLKKITVDATFLPSFTIGKEEDLTDAAQKVQSEVEAVYRPLI